MLMMAVALPSFRDFALSIERGVFADSWDEELTTMLAALPIV